MNRMLKYIISCLLPLAMLSCIKEDMPVVYGNEGIILSINSGVQTKAVADTDVEAKVSHIDVMIFDASENKVHYERISDNGTNRYALSARKSSFTAGAGYYVYLIANSTENESAYDAVATVANLKSMISSSPSLIFTGLKGDGDPQTFIMDAVAYQGDAEPAAPSTVKLNDGVLQNDTEIKAVLRRAAAKIFVTINEGADVAFVTDAADIAKSEYFMRNHPYTTPVISGVSYVPFLASTPRGAISDHFQWTEDKVTVTAYAYAHDWKNESVLEKETSLIVNIPLVYQGTKHEQNWYKIPVSQESRLDRNSYYSVSVTVNAPGAKTVEDPMTLIDVTYGVEEWKDVTVSVGAESNMPQYLQLNTNHVDMYNVNTDDSTLEFVSSSEIKNITLVRAYYINKFGQEVNVNPGITATAASGLNGGITIFSPFVKETGVVSADSHNNVIRYMEFLVTNESGQTKTFTVNQYPTIYITHELGHYSYRSDFGGTDYNQAGNPNRSGADWNNGWSYTSSAGSSNFFASKVAGTYTIGSDGKATQNAAGSNGSYSISYVYWGTSGFGSGGQVSRRTQSVGAGFNNPRMYHIHVTATSDKYIVARPSLDAQGFTDSSAENAMLVSPSFMIASQLGTTDMSGGSSSVSIDKAKQHCEQYVEVTYDAAGNKVIYDDWRLPTAREIDIILDHQYDSQAMVEVLSGRRYYCAFNPDGSGTTQYLRENTSSTGGSNHVRCIRDAY